MAATIHLQGERFLGVQRVTLGAHTGQLRRVRVVTTTTGILLEHEVDSADSETSEVRSNANGACWSFH